MFLSPVTWSYNIHTSLLFTKNNQATSGIFTVYHEKNKLNYILSFAVFLAGIQFDAVTDAADFWRENTVV